MMRRIKCFFGFCPFVRTKFCERICPHCGGRWVFSEIEHPRIRTGRWFYMGTLLPDELCAALARVQGGA